MSEKQAECVELNFVDEDAKDYFWSRAKEIVGEHPRSTLSARACNRLVAHLKEHYDPEEDLTTSRLKELMEELAAERQASVEERKAKMDLRPDPDYSGEAKCQHPECRLDGDLQVMIGNVVDEDGELVLINAPKSEHHGKPKTFGMFRETADGAEVRGPYCRACQKALERAAKATGQLEPWKGLSFYPYAVAEAHAHRNAARLERRDRREQANKSTLEDFFGTPKERQRISDGHPGASRKRVRS